MVIQPTDEQQKYIEWLAKERGYDNPTDYVLALVEADDYIDDPEKAAIDLEEQFREAWHEAMTGEGIRSADEVLDEIRRERKQNDRKNQ